MEYTQIAEVAHDHLELVRLWLCRFVHHRAGRFLARGTGASDLAVSAAEAEYLLAGGKTPATDGAAALAVPELDDVLASITAFEARISERVMLTVDERLTGIEGLAQRLRLTAAGRRVLIAAVAFQLDPDIARLYRFVWADYSAMQPTVGFLCDLVSQSSTERNDALDALAPSAPLRQLGIVSLEHAREWDGPTPLSFRRVRVPDEVAAFAAGRVATGTDRGLARWVEVHAPLPDPDFTPLPSQTEALGTLRTALSRVARQPTLPPVAMFGPVGGGRLTLLRMAAGNERVVSVTLDPTAAALDQLNIIRSGLRRAALLGAIAAVRFRELDAADAPQGGPTAAPARPRDVSTALEDQVTPVVLLAERPDQLDGIDLSASIVLATPTEAEQRQIWEWALARAGWPVPDGIDSVCSAFRLTPGPIAAAVERQRRVGSAAPTSVALAAMVRQQLPRTVASLAHRVETGQSWDDLVLPADVFAELQYLSAAARHVETVYEAWNFRSRVPYGRSISALLSGPPGTGKTMAAAVIAKDLGRELYRVDLSRVVDKYIGETEKNLGRLFDHAERAQAILLFDEADALFARRTEVKSSNDRYANLGVNYLLQRMEAFTGVTLLTTNFADSLDDALARRIAVKVRFPMPDATARVRLWKKLIPEEAPLEGEIDWEYLSETFELAGGHIKSAVLRAAFSAAEAGDSLTFDRLWDGAVATYREMGRLVGKDLTG